MTDQPLRIAVFASGSGSNMEAILEAVDSGRIPAEVVLCVSNRTEAGALERARRWRIPSAVLSPDRFPDEESYCNALSEALEKAGVNFIALAGYLRKIPSSIVRAFRGRLLNIHPALLPAFGGQGMYGRRVHQAVLDHGVRWTGVTVHLVDDEYDTGPIVLQQPVPVDPDDTPETLAARVLETEHLLYPEAIRLFALGQVHIVGRVVRITDVADAPRG